LHKYQIGLKFACSSYTRLMSNPHVATKFSKAGDAETLGPRKVKNVQDY